MKKQLFGLLCLLLVVAACATTGVKPETPATANHEPSMIDKARLLFLLSQGYLSLQEGNAPLAFQLFDRIQELGYVIPEILRLKAIILIQSGAIDQAMGEIDLALQQDPQDVETLALKAGVLAATGKREEAIEIYRAILDLKPDYEMAAIFIAGLYEETGENRKAEKTLEQFTKHNPEAYQSFFELGRLNLVDEQWAAAKKYFTKVTELEPEFARGWIGLGFACEGLGDRPAAIVAYQHAIELNPDDRALHRQLIGLHLRTNNPDAAMAETQRLELLGGGTADTTITRGVVLFHQGRTVDALAQFNLVLEKEPKNNQARYLAAVCLARLNKIPESLDNYRQIPKESSYYLEARLNLATLLMRLGQNGNALVELDLLEKDFPNELDVLRTRGSVLSSMGRFEQAEEVLQRALKLQPDDPESIYSLAVLYERSGRWKQGVQVMEKRLEKDPNDVDALNFIGYTLADHNADLSRAEKLLAKAVKMKPYSGHIVDSYGWALYRMGRYDQAIENLKHALELEPSEAVIAEHIGDAYAAKGDTQQAREYWHKAMTLNPEPDTSARLKGKLGE